VTAVRGAAATLRRATLRRVARVAVVAGLGAGVLSGCGQSVVIHEEVLACEVGDDGEPANGVVLMAQSVPSASFVPCLATMPLGWHVAEMEARDDGARFWLDSDRDGVHAIEVAFTEGCDTSGATEIPSDRADMRRFEEVTRLSPQYVGRRSYVFEGGCVSVLFRLSGRDRTEPLAVATQAIGAVSRERLRDHVHEETGGRLELDPPEAGSGGS
jgi:hypothetical protein